MHPKNLGWYHATVPPQVDSAAHLLYRPYVPQVEIAPHYYSKKEIMEQAAKKLPKTLGKAAE